jgi:hypothetical protein
MPGDRNLPARSSARRQHAEVVGGLFIRLCSKESATLACTVGPPTKDPVSSKECAERLKALADADRLKIVQLLRGGPKNVSKITAELGQEIANVSHHLPILSTRRYA